jgi:hypothetical protein
MPDIRLGIEVAAGQTSITGLSQVTSQISADLNSALGQFGTGLNAQFDKLFGQITKISNAATIGFRYMGESINQQFSQTLTILEKIEQATNRIRAAGGGGGGAGGVRAGGASANIDLESVLSRLQSQGFAASGRQSKTYTPNSLTEVDELVNSIGRKVNATYNTQGDLSRITLGMQPKLQPSAADAQKAVNDAVQRARTLLGSQGFFQVGQRIQGGPQGDQSISIFRNASGAIARLNEDTGKFSANLETAQSRWSGLVGNFRSGLSTIQAIGQGIASWVYLAERAGGAIKAAVVTPVEDLLHQVVTATEESRKFEYAISSSVGGLSKARLINNALVRGSQDSPLSVEQYREATRTIGLNSVLASRLSSGTPEDAVRQASQFASLVGRLGQIEPEQGVQGATIAIREALQGNFQSTQRRLGISQGTIASLSGVRSSELAANPNAILKGIGSFADIFLSQSEFERSKSLISVRVQHLQDAFNDALRRIGDSGVFDSVSKRIGNLSKELFDYFGGSDFDQQADRISGSLDKIIGNITSAINNLIRAVTGTPADVSTVAGAVEAVSNLMERIAKISDALPNITSAIGPAISGLATKIGAFMDAVISIADIAKDPGAYAKRVASSAASGIADMVDDPMGLNSIMGIRTERMQSQNSADGYSGRPLPFYGTSAQTASTPRMIADAYGGMAALKPRGDEDESQAFLRAYYHGLVPTPNFGTFTKLTGNQNEALAAMGEHSQTRLDRLQKASAGLFADVNIEDADHVTHKYTQGQFKQYLTDQYNTSLSGLQKQRDEMGGRFVETGDADAIKAVDYLSKQITDLTSSYNSTITAITQGKLEGVKQFGDALGRAITDLPPEAQLQIQKSIYTGTTSLAKQYAAAFGVPPGGMMKNFGFDSMTIPEQREFVESNQRSGLQAASDRVKLGLATPRDATRAKINFLGSEDFQSMQTRALANATSEAAAHPGDSIAAGNLIAAQNQILATQAEMKELKHSIDDSAIAFEEFGARSRDALESNLGNAINGLIKGTGSLKDALLGFVNDITSAFSQLAAKNIVNGLIGQLGQPGQGTGGVGSGGAGGLLGGILGAFGFGALGASSGGGLAGGTAVAAHGTTPASTFYKAAQGGIFPGSFLPFHAFSTGGIASSPTFGLIGEAGQAEAVVPLPGNRQIPVQLRGGTGGFNGDVYFVYNEEEAQARGFDRHKDLFADYAAREIRKPGSRLNRAARSS